MRSVVKHRIPDPIRGRALRSACAEPLDSGEGD